MAKMSQNWNNVISYIKFKLGVPHNQLEISDNDMQEYLSEHVLQQFSEEFPLNKWVVLSIADKIPLDVDTNQSLVEHSFRLPTDDINVESVHEVYPTTTGSLGAVAAGTGAVWNYNPVDQLLQSNYSQIHDELNPVQSYWFVPPNTISFELNPFAGSADRIIVEISGHYDAVNQIDADMYQLFKKLCLLEILKHIRTIRSRYSSLETPAGAIQMNMGYIESQIQELQGEVNEKITNIPPRILVSFLD